MTEQLQATGPAKIGREHQKVLTMLAVKKSKRREVDLMLADKSNIEHPTRITPKAPYATLYGTRL